MWSKQGNQNIQILEVILTYKESVLLSLLEKGWWPKASPACTDQTYVPVRKCEIWCIYIYLLVSLCVAVLHSHQAWRTQLALKTYITSQGWCNSSCKENPFHMVSRYFGWHDLTYFLICRVLYANMQMTPCSIPFCSIVCDIFLAERWSVYFPSLCYLFWFQWQLKWIKVKLTVVYCRINKIFLIIQSCEMPLLYIGNIFSCYYYTRKRLCRHSWVGRTRLLMNNNKDSNDSSCRTQDRCEHVQNNISCLKLFMHAQRRARQVWEWVLFIHRQYCFWRKMSRWAAGFGFFFYLWWARKLQFL